jgi:hypothetical protein
VSLLAQKKNNNQARLHHCGAKSFRGYSNGVIAPLYSLRLLPRVKTRGYKYEIPPGLTTQKNQVAAARILSCGLAVRLIRLYSYIKKS